MSLRQCLRHLVLLPAAVLLLASGTSFAPAATMAASPPVLLPGFWTPDGPVYTIAATANTVYLGGKFGYVGPNTGSFASLDIATGKADASPAGVQGEVRAAASDGGGGWFVGGSFTAVGGVARQSLAHVRADGSLDQQWTVAGEGYPIVSVKYEVRALAVGAGKLFVGGTFATLNGQKRDGLAAFDLATGALLDWAPLAGEFDPTLSSTPEVNALLISPDGALLYVLGSSNPASSVAFRGVAVFDAASGAFKRQFPATFSAAELSPDGAALYGVNFNVARAISTADGTELWSTQASGYEPRLNTLKVDGDMFYVGGAFDTIGGQSRTNIAALNRLTGTPTDWSAGAPGGVDAITVAGGVVYAGGTFWYAGPDPSQPAERRNLAAFSATSGTLLPWDSVASGPSQSPVYVKVLLARNGRLFVGGTFTSVGGKVRSNAAALDARTGELTAWKPDIKAPYQESGVYAIAIGQNAVYVGGSFYSSDVLGYACLVAFDLDSGALLPNWKPDVQEYGCKVASLILSGNTLYVGGAFDKIGSQSPQPARLGLAALDVTSAAATAWNPEPRPFSDGEGVTAMALRDTTLYIGGTFGQVGGQLRNHLAAVDTQSGLPTSWNPGVDDVFYNYPVHALALSEDGDTVFVGGRFRQIGGTHKRRGLAAIDASNGAVRPWDPAPSSAAGEGPVTVEALAPKGDALYVGGLFDSIGTQNPQAAASNVAVVNTASGEAASFVPNTVITQTVAFASVEALVPSGDRVYVGGSFNLVGGKSQPFFAAFGQPGAATTQAPTTISTTTATLAGSVDTGDSQATASFELTTTSGDYANARVVPASPSTVAGVATVSVTITGLQPGTTYFYRLVASGPFGTIRTAEQQFATLAAPGVPPTPSPTPSATGVPPAPSPTPSATGVPPSTPPVKVLLPVVRKP